MKIRSLLLSLFIIAPFYSSEAQKVYGLDECIGTGLERNFSLLVTRNSETISSNNYTLGNAGYLPTLDLTSRYNGTLNNTTQNLTDGSQTTSNGVNNTIANAGVSLGWSIFSGFNVRTTYKKLDELKQLGALNTQLAAENMVADIISSYFLVIQQVQTVKNLEYAVTLSKERLRIDEERYLLGSNSKLQVLQSRVYYNADSSRLSKQTEVLKAAQIRLNELMAVEEIGSSFYNKRHLD